MLIRSLPAPVIPDSGKLKTLSENPEAPPPADDPPKKKKIISTVAYASGGTMGGLVLGGIGGTLLTNVTGQPIFQQAGALVGAAAGGASGLLAAQSNQPGTLGRTLVAWTTATAGTGAGYYACNRLGNILMENGASAFFGPNAALVGAVAGGLAGAAVAFTGHHVKSSFILKHAASGALGGTAGMLLGGGVQSLMAASAPALSYMTAAAPLIGAVAGTLVGLSLYGHSNDPPSYDNGGY